MTYNDYEAARKKASIFLKKSAVDEIASGQFNEPGWGKKRTVDITARGGAQFSESIEYHSLNNDGHVTKIRKIGSSQRRAGVSAKDAQAASINLAEAVSRWTEEKAIHRSVREIRRWSSSRTVRYGGTGKIHGIRTIRTTSELAKQLDAQRKRAITDHIDCGAHGVVNVQWVSTPDECGIYVDEKYENGYSNRCPYYMTVRTVTVRAVLESRGNLVAGDRRILHAPDLDCVVLACKPISPPEMNVDIQACDAVIARKRRGIDYEVRRAIILATEYRGGHVVAGDDMANAVARLRRAVVRGGGSIIEKMDVETARDELLAGNIEVNQDIACALIRAIEMYTPGAGDIKGMIKLLLGLDDSGALSNAGILHAVAANPEFKLLDLHSVVLAKFRDEINSVRNGNTALDILVDRQAPEKLINLYLDHGADETLLNAQRSVDFYRIVGGLTVDRPPAQAQFRAPNPIPDPVMRLGQ